MEPAELFANLDSNQPCIAEEAKKSLHQTLNLSKEPWLLNGIFDYYVVTGSARCIEILVSVREPHDKYLFDKICESLKGPAKLHALTILGHVLRKQPGWLYKITQHPLFRELLKLLKNESEILPLISALLALVVLLPMIPSLMGPYLQDVFDIFSRLTAWNCSPGRLAEEQLVHLQIAMYALFLRLYGMYPCNFVAYLRNHYSMSDNKPVFMHTVRPMLNTVKIHPQLVTASRDNETDTNRWKKMGYDDVIVECERFAVDTADRYRDDSCYSGLTPSFRSRSNTDHSTESSPFTLPTFKFPITSSTPSCLDQKEIWSPSMYFCQHSNSPPPLPEVSAPTSIPHTPNSISSSVFPHHEGTSPPEAAIEATPETTPIKDTRVRGPPMSSAVVRALTNLSANNQYSNVPIRWPINSGTTTPNSQPSSPMRKDPNPFKFPHEGSAFELSTRKQNTGVSQKLARLMEDRTQVNENFNIPRGKTQIPPSSPLRVISRQETIGSVPSSPVPLIDISMKDWPIAKPRPISSPGVPMIADSNQEDQEVVEIVKQGEQFEQKAHRTQQCDSVLQEFQVSQDEEYDDCEQEHGSPCTSGGLHMPNSHSLQAFATRVNRLRYYSQCAPEPARPEINDQNGTDHNVSLQSNLKVRRANSCPEMKKNYPSVAAQTKGILDESDELSAENSSTPVPGNRHNFSNGIDNGKICNTVSTQTLELPMPYEHLFIGIFPMLENTEIKPSPAPSPAPYVNMSDLTKNIRFSPYEMLDKYIEQAVHYGDSKEDQGRHIVKLGHHGTLTQSIADTELRLREQLNLLHLQLQYERHRREVHAVRNRRLLGESRSNKALDEHNSALRDQLSILQKDIESLRDQLNIKKQESVNREKELQDMVNYWQSQCHVSKQENKILRDKTENLDKLLAEQERISKELTERCQRTEARLFQVESEMDVALAQARHSQKIAADLEKIRTELLLAGEINQRYQETLAQLPHIKYRDEEKQLLTAAYHDEIKNLNQQLEMKNSILEYQKARITELENQTKEYDEMCATQKRMLREVEEAYHEQLRAVEDKYKTQRAINQKMEDRILELYQKMESVKTVYRRPAHYSPDTSSCHEAMGGASKTEPLTSPHSSPPLSASLASSEGSMKAYLMQHSQKDEQLKEIKNLQVIVNQSESDSRTSHHLSSEETTPDGTARSLSSLNHSE